jgi:glycosyltransferase involved in cell wall biosynthesis
VTAAGQGESGPGGDPSISVIIPTHNRAAMLGRALSSVFAQKFTGLEVIVVNDGSSDATAASLLQFSDPRLRIIHHPQPMGAAAARNAGLKLVRAPVVAFLDDDDEQLPGFLAETVRAHATLPRVDLCWTGVIYRQPDGSEKTLDWSRWAGSARFVNRLAGCCGISFRTEWLRAAGGFDTSFRITEDTDLFMRVVEAKARWRCINRPLMRVYVHPGTSLSRSGNSELHIEHIRRLFERHGPLIESDPVIRSQYRGALANHLYRVGRKTEARREVLRMLTHRGSRLRGLESIMRFELRRGARSGR